MSDVVRYLVNEEVGNNKVFTVPVGKAWEVKSGSALITTSIAPGSRTPPTIQIQDENGLTLFSVAGTASVAASQTDAAFGIVGPDTAQELTVPPGIVVGPGGVVRYRDGAGIDPDDTLKVYLQVITRPVVR
ncbi:MAG: hypothetical protein GY906_33970 [bacterium]|nr:hypothetical protein [bacterium]